MNEIFDEPCDICRTKKWERIRFGKFVCDACEPAWDGFPLFMDTVTLCRNMPGEQICSKAERDEWRRNVAVPIGNGKHKCGRIGENGKIQEKPIKV